MDHVTHNGHISDEDLSLYLDGALDSSEDAVVVARHLTECDECRERLDDLRAISAALAQLPEPPLPRSFRLTAQDLPRPVAPILIEPWFMRFQPAIRSAAAIAAVLLLTVVGASLILDATTETADEGAISMMEAAPEERAVEEDAAEAPPVDAEMDEPAEDADVGIAAEPEGEADSPESLGQVEAVDDAHQGVRALWIIGALLAAVTVALGIAGFVLPRWWSRSHARRE